MVFDARQYFKSTIFFFFWKFNAEQFVQRPTVLIGE